MRYFMISVDTEGDNQWDTSKGISTQNTRYLPRFQELCEKYGYKPVWLTNYEMANDDAFVQFFKGKQDDGLCEIGMHLHAWYTPPEYKLEKKTDARDYLIEYPTEIMDKKIETMTRLLEDKFGQKVVSHRSGRWAMDDRYFELLKKHGYKVDCSVTPHADWSGHPGRTGMGGTDYTNYPEKPYITDSGLLEIPVSIRNMHFFNKEKATNPYNGLKEIKHMITGTTQWLRFFDTASTYAVEKLADELIAENSDVLFMIHSSELMPGGSPNFKDESEIDRLYDGMDRVFKKFADAGFSGCTMRDYLEELLRR